MKKIPFDPSRRQFIKTGLIYLPAAALLTRFSVIDLVGASSIKSRTVSSVVEERASLANSHFARPHGVATWNKLRIALRLSSTDTGAVIGGTPEFAVGLCAGTTNIYGDATTDHFAGLHTHGSQFDRGTVGGVPYYASTGSTVRPIKKVVSTVTTGTDIAVTAVVVLGDAASAFHRVLLFVDITKGSPNYTFSLFWFTAGGLVDASASDFAIQAASASPTFSQHQMSTGQTLAVDEATNGTLNCVNLLWDKATPQIEISDLAVVRLS